MLCREHMHAILVEELAGPKNDEEAECQAQDGAVGIGMAHRGVHFRVQDEQLSNMC